MLKLLQEISQRALLLNEYDFTEEQQRSKWLGTSPASDEEIKAAKASLEVELPEDYVEFLKTTNGFHQCSITGVTFLPINEIDYLINVDEDLIDIWNTHEELSSIVQALSASLMIGGLNEEQYFLLIPPSDSSKSWRYWKFASWIPGEHEFKDLKDYFSSELKFLKEETKGLTKPKPKFVTDHSLRDYAFNLDWENVYRTAFRFLREDRSYHYFDGHVDLLKLLLLAASKLNSFERLETDLRVFRENNNRQDWLNEFVVRFEDAARNGNDHIPDLQRNKFVMQSDSTTLQEIEEQTKIHRPQLLKPRNLGAKVDYQLLFLFGDGNAKEFIALYKAYFNSLSSNSHIMAAIIYANTNQHVNAQDALERYFHTEFNCRALEPFLNNVLVNLMTADFLKKVLLNLAIDGKK